MISVILSFINFLSFYGRKAESIFRSLPLTHQNPSPTNRELYSIADLTNFYKKYEGWNFNSGNYLFTTDTK